MEHPEGNSGEVRSIFKQLIVAIILAACAILLASAFTHAPKPFSSVEVKFTDAAANGLAIVPASCPSNPGDSDSPFGCDGSTPLCPDGSDAPGGNVANCPGGGGGGTPGGGGCPPGSTASGDLCVEACQSGGPQVVGGVPQACTCPAGFNDENGECVIAQCSPGETYQNGVCTVSSCGAGQTMQNGVCVQNGQCLQEYVCSGSNLVFQNRDCSYSNPVACPLGCSDDACISPPSPNIDIVASPTLLKPSEISQISWKAANVTSCTITGTNGDSWSCSGSACSATTTKPSSPIVAQTTYTLSCTGDDNSSEGDSVIVSVVPTFNEQ